MVCKEALHNKPQPQPQQQQQAASSKQHHHHRTTATAATAAATTTLTSMPRTCGWTSNDAQSFCNAFSTHVCVEMVWLV
jgi:hypothetical protein